MAGDEEVGGRGWSQQSAFDPGGGLALVDVSKTF